MDKGAFSCHDKFLFACVTCLLLVDVIILTSWQVIDPFEVTFQNISTSQETTDYLTVYHLESCRCRHLLAWTAAIFIYKGLLLVFGCFLAYETRKITIPGLNDSKYIGICVYNVVIMCIVGITVSMVTSEKPNIRYAFQSGSIWFCSTTTICLIFIPKIKYVRADLRQDNRGNGSCISKPSLSNTFTFSLGLAGKQKETETTQPTTPPMKTTAAATEPTSVSVG